MKILSIGNSFSQDAQRWLHDIALSAGSDVTCANLYIGGCSLERHYNNVKNSAPEYGLEINGIDTGKKVSINDTVKNEKWDVVTLQQVSQLSGMEETYEPYFSYIYGFINENAPEARIMLHETWAYETTSTHPGFANYERDQKKMADAISACCKSISAKYGTPVIPVGDCIRYVRENIKEFDVSSGGMSLNRDGFHLTNVYGRYLAGLVWYGTIAGGDIGKVTFVPNTDGFVTDERIISLLKGAAQSFTEK